VHYIWNHPVSSKRRKPITHCNNVISNKDGILSFVSAVHKYQDYWDILKIKAHEMHYLSTLFGKELYLFRTNLLSIIKSLNTVFTEIGICHTSYVAVW
jgi:hypothetical protein